MKKSMPVMTPAIAADLLGTSVAGIERLVWEGVLETVGDKKTMLILDSEVQRLLDLGCTTEWIIFWDECPDCGRWAGSESDDEPRALVAWFDVPSAPAPGWVYTDYAIGTRA